MWEDERQRRVLDIYDDIQDFVELLETAELNSHTEKQAEFINTMIDEFNAYGGFMLIEREAHRNLLSLAKGNHDEFFITGH